MYDKKIRKYVIMLFICICMTVMRSIIVFASETDPSGNASDYSFDTMSSTVAAALSSTYADADDAATSLENRYGRVTPGSAGGLLAYTDKNNSNAIWGMFMQALSMGSNTIDYSSLSGDLSEKIGTSYPHVFNNYVAFGAALADMGLDQTDSAVASVGLLTQRGMIGGLALAAFILSQSICLVFGFVITLLKTFNPFSLFHTVSSSAIGGWLSHLKTAGDVGGTSGFLAGTPVATFIGTLYDLLVDFGLVILTILFLITVIKLFLPAYKGQRLSGFKKWFIQGLFLFGGIALLGRTYTDVLGYLGDATAGGNTAAAKVIASTFCDFEGWAKTGFVKGSIPNIRARFTKGKIYSNSSDVQTICYAVNQVAISGSGMTLSSFGSTGSIDVIIDDLSHDVSSPVVSAAPGITPPASSPTGDNVTKWIVDLLMRYMTGKKFFSSSYESLWKSKNWNDANSSTALNHVAKELFSSSSIFNERLEDTTTSTNIYDDLFLDSSGGGAILSPAGGSSVINPFSAGTGYALGKYSSTVNNGAYDVGGLGTADINSYSSSTTFAPGGWSAMSVYNYLNTTFYDSSLITYSAANSASNYVRDSHYSVNLVGKGILAMIYFMVCITLLFTYSILGFYYGFGIIMTNIKRGIRLIVAVPGAMLGSVQSIARVVSYTVLMIIEIIMNILLYCLTVELLYTFAVEFVSQLTTYATTTTGFFSSSTPDLFSYIMGIMVILFLIWFTVQAIKLRNPIVKSLEEAADNVVQKFIIGAPAHANANANGQVNGNMAAKGAGTGAGAYDSSIPGSHRPAKGLENFIPLYASAKNADAKRYANKAKNEAEGRKMLSDMGLTDGTSSAITDERVTAQYKAAKRKAKADAVKAKMTGNLKTAVGAAEVAAGYATGNAFIAAKGTSNIADGVSDTVNADTNKTNELAFAAAKANASVNPEDSVSAELAKKTESNITPSEGIDIGKETQALTGAAIAGSMGVAGINGADFGNVASEVTKTETVKTSRKTVKDASMSIEGNDMSGIEGNNEKGLNDTDMLVSSQIRKDLVVDSNLTANNQTSVNGSVADPNDVSLNGASKDVEMSVQSTVNEKQNINKDVSVKKNKDLGMPNDVSLNGASKDVEMNVQSTVNEKQNINKDVSVKKNKDLGMPNDSTKSEKTDNNINVKASKTVNGSSTDVNRSAQTSVKSLGGGGSRVSTSVTSSAMHNHTTMVSETAEVKTVGSSGMMVKKGNMSSSKTLSGTQSHVSMKSEELITEERTTTVKQVNKINPGGGSSGSGGYLGSRAVSGRSSAQTVHDTVTVQHDTQYNHVGGNSGTGNYNGPTKVSGGNYNQSVNDTVNVNHNNQFNHNMGNADSGSAVRHPQAQGNDYIQDVTDFIEVDHDEIVNHKNPGGELHTNNQRK